MPVIVWILIWILIGAAAVPFLFAIIAIIGCSGTSSHQSKGEPEVEQWKQ